VAAAMKWAQARIGRTERELMSASLDERIGSDHGIRLLDGLLSELDWSEWEAAYERDGAGRPPIHPQQMCAALLYGLIKRIRSLRELEEATRVRLDFQWLLEGRAVDHTTFGTFKKRFDGKIGELFKQINRKAASLRGATIEEVVVDGSRMRADSDRHGARTARGLEGRLRQLDEHLAGALEQLEDCEGQVPAEREQLEKELRRIEAQREKLEVALEEARRRDDIKRAKDGAKATPVRVPVSDPDSHIMPNKEGGYAPNYTPVAAVESEHGLVVGAEIAEANAEAATLGGLLDEAAGLAEAEPKRILFDGGFASGSNLEELGQRGVEVYAGCGGNDEDNPALRSDGTKPVAEALLGKLPKRGGKFDRAAFLYDASKDCYYCPLGRLLSPYRKIKRRISDGSQVKVMEYRCSHCSDCPLAEQCLSGKAKVRSVGRDEYQDLRDELAEKMSTEQARQIYARRAPVVEGTFGTIKSALGIRRFSRRGMRKVRADWQWICAAFNLMKLMKNTSLPCGAFPACLGPFGALRAALRALPWPPAVLRWLTTRLGTLFDLSFRPSDIGFVASR
jgi:transposase